MVIVLYCQSCNHYWGENKCEAFPEGIPEGIFRGQVLHEEPTKDQKNNIVFKKRK